MEYIERCLTSCEPIADEICLVRAVGTLKPDRTTEIARNKFGARIGEYQNAPGHDWPHVDDFAAARQMSFDMATGDYCFWVDTDDVLESGVDIVRKLAERGGYACYVFPYKIFGRGLMVPRGPRPAIPLSYTPPFHAREKGRRGLAQPALPVARVPNP